MITRVEDARNTSMGWVVDIRIGNQLFTTPPEPTLVEAKKTSNMITLATLESWVVTVYDFYSRQGAALVCNACGKEFYPSAIKKTKRHKPSCKSVFPDIPRIKDPWALVFCVLSTCSR